ncbi:UDP-glucose 4-epimerase [Heliophilum fasciatum]|uniref:UDP-glucose 4-epimerase n=1 Tax=Heliophilum fasciatum TaxID=35700 RepID=A0A4R2RYI7_9FIRM|nr:UDP-glucose 4-epimerase [Heliophilum fasciatum]TCP64165.1 UDP-glucose 4-epimerase [Heliophilum fasciatum]
MFLVTGGAGYIGSHTVLALQASGHAVVVLDNLSTGHRDLVPEGALFYQGDIADADLVGAIFRRHPVEGVLHFAARSLVGESMGDPGAYFLANTAGTASLLQTMARHGVKRFVLSSTAAVYGEPETVPIDEGHRQQSTNPYGLSKWMIEQMLPWFERVHGLRWAALRYFNAAGADPAGRSGERHDPETHLIPNVLKVALGERSAVTVFGDDYPTPDGTCLRDYVHVADLADAHVLAMQHLDRGGPSGVFNLGNGRGFSVLEVIAAARKVTGQPIPVMMEGRRAGDPAVLVASNERARHVLGWQPRYGDLETIVATAWSFAAAKAGR